MADPKNTENDAATSGASNAATDPPKLATPAEKAKAAQADVDRLHEESTQ